MVGGLIQLMYVGKGNTFVTNPKISFFKKQYSNYINFSSQFIELFFNNIKFDSFQSFFDNNTFIKLPIYGDLLNKLYIKLKFKYSVNPFDLQIHLHQSTFSINNITISKNNFLPINNINNNLLIDDIIFFNNNFNINDKVINKFTKYKIYDIQDSSISFYDLNDDIIEFTSNDIFSTDNSINQIIIYSLNFNSNTNGILYEDVFNQNNKKNRYLYNYIYLIQNSPEITNILFQPNEFQSIIDINDNLNRLNLTNYNNKIYYKITTTIEGSNSNDTHDLIFSGIININIIKEDITKLIKEVSYEIDEYTMEKHSSEWLLTYDKLFDNNEKNNIINQNIKYITSDLFNSDLTLYIPLRFSFCNHMYDSLPIASLYNSDNYIRVKLNSIDNIFITSKIIDYSNSYIKSFSLVSNYIYIDVKYRKFFSSDVKQKLLIEQVQQQNNIININQTNNIHLNFTYFSKILIWVLPYKYILNEASIIFNQENIVPPYEGTYFNLIQPLQHNLGNTQSFSRMEDNKDINGTYYVYSFCLYPTIKQPSGLCNLSRIDDKILQLNIKYINNNNHTNNITTNIFSVNYNYLIIQNGKGKLEYI